MPVNRRALVTSTGPALGTVDSLSHLALTVPSTAALARPALGGNQDGWHYQPAVGDEVVALAEVGNSVRTAVSALDPTKLTSMPARTTTLFSQGTTLLSAGSGTVTLSHATVATQLTLTGQTITHSATAGSDTLPANPALFLSVLINGTTYKIPAYLP